MKTITTTGLVVGTDRNGTFSVRIAGQRLPRGHAPIGFVHDGHLVLLTDDHIPEAVVDAVETFQLFDYNPDVDAAALLPQMHSLEDFATYVGAIRGAIRVGAHSEVIRRCGFIREIDLLDRIEALPMLVFGLVGLSDPAVAHLGFDQVLSTALTVAASNWHLYSTPAAIHDRMIREFERWPTQLLPSLIDAAAIAARPLGEIATAYAVAGLTGLANPRTAAFRVLHRDDIAWLEQRVATPASR